MWKKALMLPLGCALLTMPRVLGAGFIDSKDRPKLHTRRDPTRSSEWLKRQVGHQLRMLPYYSVFDELEYRVDAYRVELLGEVIRPTLKSDAEAAVKRIEGVEGVTNHIEVLPLSPNDDRIRLACYRAIYRHPVLERYALQHVPPIHIIVKNGNITLVGVVASEMDREVADIQANGVHGAFSVTDKLQVEKHAKNT